jgi:hypothetical protein
MADDIERRVTKLEKTLDEHLVVIHGYIDELRVEHVHSLKRIEQNEERIRQNEKAIGQLQSQGLKLIDIHADLVKIVKGMNGMLMDHENRLSKGNL